MNLITKRFGRFTLGIWYALFALAVLFLVAWAGQTRSLVNRDVTIDLGIQKD